VKQVALLDPILVGITLGPIAGLISGIAFGFVSFFHAVLRPASAFSLFFINPFISILPRMFIGVTAYYAYKGFYQLLGGKKGRSLAIGIGAAVGSLTNTILVLLALVVIYGGKIESMLTEAGLTARAMAWAIGVAGTNGLIEAVISVILVSAIGVVYFKQFKV
jgi:uncharacterized membrane protein